MKPPDESAGLARRGDPDTSKAAAASVKVGRIEQAVYECLCNAARGGLPGLTAETVSRIIGIDKQSVTPRFRRLADMGMIRETPERQKNSSGRSAIVWTAVMKPPGEQGKLWCSHTRF